MMNSGSSSDNAPKKTKKSKRARGKGKSSSRRKKKNKDGEKQFEMAPLYLFLASSLNVELVYVILTSVTQFAYLKKDERGDSLTLDSSNRSVVSQSMANV